MNLSKRGEYALRVLVDLAMASARGRRLVSLAALAQAQRIPVAFLEQILLGLRQAHVLVSTRGKHGGYSLARPASAYRMGELIRLLEGPLVSVGCVAGEEGVRCVCPDPAHCGLRRLMVRVHEALVGVTETLTLEDLALETLGGYERDGLLPCILREPEKKGEGERQGREGKGRREGDAEPEYWI